MSCGGEYKSRKNLNTVRGGEILPPIFYPFFGPFSAHFWPIFGPFSAHFYCGNFKFYWNCDKIEKVGVFMTGLQYQIKELHEQILKTQDCHAIL
jgi:hypothetical protein